MYGATAAEETTADSERTAFRKAEKRYKLYKSQISKSRKKKSHEEGTDLSYVFDFRAILESFERSGETPNGVFPFKCSGFDRPVFCFDDRPGFYFIPGALTFQEQVHWIRESLTAFPQPPNRTNHTAIYGSIFDLFSAVQNQKVLIEEERNATDLEPGLSPGEYFQVSHRYVFSEANAISQKGETCKSIAASFLLRKLRWSTLGLQFDWSKRNYDVSLHHNKIPDALCLLAKKMASPAMPRGEGFQPEAAIVNYFGPSDMLGGHVDDMEADWSKPIVSISLGCKAVFLLGGKSREDLPIAMFLRSGDIVLMAGQARECFHALFKENPSRLSFFKPPTSKHSLLQIVGTPSVLQCSAEPLPSSRHPPVHLPHNRLHHIFPKTKPPLPWSSAQSRSHPTPIPSLFFPSDFPADHSFITKPKSISLYNTQSPSLRPDLLFPCKKSKTVKEHIFIYVGLKNLVSSC